MPSFFGGDVVFQLESNYSRREGKKKFVFSVVQAAICRG